MSLYEKIYEYIISSYIENLLLPLSIYTEHKYCVPEGKIYYFSEIIVFEKAELFVFGEVVVV